LNKKEFVFVYYIKDNVINIFIENITVMRDKK